MRELPRARRWVAAAVVLLAGLPVWAGGAAGRAKKLIATGWDKVNSQRLLKNLSLMERRPFDGVVIVVEGRIDQKRRCPMRRTFIDEQWRREWFQPCIRNLRACKFKRFTDNFMQVGANPGNVDWFDDAGWRRIVEHWRIAAWAARQSGFRGLLFDPEPYTRPHAQFKYFAQPQRDKHSFAEYAGQARLRGRQVMEAVAAEYPDITLFCYFMNIAGSRAVGQKDPARVLSAEVYGLYPAFIDGWLDAAGPKVTFVDGCEWSYRYNSVVEYLEAAVLIKGGCQELVSPANRAKYRAQVQVSFGMYLDAYWNPKDSKWGAWYVDGKGRPRVERLRENVATALRVADEYVWVYGEKFRWWPTPNGRVRAESWPEALPGCERALAYARDPVGFARERIAAGRASGKLANLSRNGDFSSAKAPPGEAPAADWRAGRPPAGWHAWQEAASKGTFTWDREAGAAGKGSARAANVANGCFLQKVRAAPGERYAVRAVRRLRGAGGAWIRVRWQTDKDAWTAVGHDKLITCGGAANEWRELFGVVEVPAGAARLVVLLGVGGQKAPEDAAWFDDVEVYKLE